MATLTQSPPAIIHAERDTRQNNRANEAARQLLRKWRTEETPDEEAAWLEVQQLIEENRLSVRRKFGE